MKHLIALGFAAVFFAPPLAQADAGRQLARHHCDLPPILKNANAAIAQEQKRLTEAGWENVEIIGRVRSFSRCWDRPGGARS